MKENRLLFTNALIVLPTETIKGSLAVEDGKITGIFESGTELPGFTEVDVHGKALMPGAIDTHVHMWDPSPLNYREDWACGSQCAASGGITTIIDMPLSVPPVVDKEGFQLKLDVAQKESCVDFAFWGGLTPNCVQNMEELNRLGCVAYKGFMSFANPDYPQVTDGYLVQGMRKAATFNGLIGVHAENELLKNETVVEKIKAATPENPAVFSVIAPDAIMTVHRDRTSGFANRMYELCQEWQPGAVAITGNDAFAKDSEKDPAVIIRTDIAASRADEDIRNLAQSVVSDSSVLAIFCVNEASATGILSATSDGLDLDRTNGKYKDLIVIGFDSGSTLNNAVRSGYFYGAVAQDPYTMGYEAMMMAINVLQGGEASDIVIPAVWFDASNMDDPEISRILYD